jgi:hypothetical protein
MTIMVIYDRPVKSKHTVAGSLVAGLSLSITGGPVAGSRVTPAKTARDQRRETRDLV